MLYALRSYVKKQHICYRTMTHKVFVYGTLKKNEPNHYWLTAPENGKGTFVSAATTKNKYPLIIATKYNIPFLLYSPGNGHHVCGEIYEVDDLMLSKLDILEGHPDYYVREVDDVVPKTLDNSNQDPVKCWVYFLKNFKNELLSKPLLETYSSSGSHGLPYTESNNESSEDDIADLIEKPTK